MSFFAVLFTNIKPILQPYLPSYSFYWLLKCHYHISMPLNSAGSPKTPAFWGALSPKSTTVISFSALSALAHMALALQAAHALVCTMRTRAVPSSFNAIIMPSCLIILSNHYKTRVSFALQKNAQSYYFFLTYARVITKIAKNT